MIRLAGLVTAFVSAGLTIGCVFNSDGIGADPPLTQTKRKRIDIQGRLGSGLSDFPVGIILQVDADLATKASSNGSDLLFTDADGETVLPFEIESYDGNTGALAAWVTVPEIDPVSGATVYLHYGASSAVTQADAFETWDDSFAGVWHLTGRSSTVIDSSRNGNHGFAPAVTVTPASSPGIAGAALDFSALRSDMVTIADPPDDSLDFGMASYSLSMWVNVDHSVGQDDTPWWKGGSNMAEAGYNVALGRDSWNVKLVSGGLVRIGSFGAESEFLRGWTHLAFVVDRDSRHLRLYANGVQTDVVDLTIFGPIENALDPTLGRPPTVFNGIVDELRIYRTALDAAWIVAEYQNLSDPVSFNSLGVEENL